MVALGLIYPLIKVFSNAVLDPQHGKEKTMKKLWTIMMSIAVSAKKWCASVLDDALYAFVDGIAVIVATIDFFIDVVRSKGHPKGSWLKYIQNTRGAMGWFLHFLQVRNAVLKTNPDCKFFFNLGNDCVVGNADEMPSEVRQLLRNDGKLLKEMLKEAEEATTSETTKKEAGGKTKDASSL